MVQISRYLWSCAFVGSACAGLFFGLANYAHSDIAKFQLLLSQNPRRAGEVIVKVRHSALSMASISQVFDTSRFRIADIKRFETDSRFYTVKLAGDEQTAQYLEAAESNPAFEYAEPNYVLHMDGYKDTSPAERIPNVSDFGLLWGMKNRGQNDADGDPGVVGDDIGATKAWAITTGNKNIVVAEIDTGVDYNHPDLKDNIFQNKADCFNDGVDHDGNGFVNDCHGWNFANGASNNDPLDDNQHGTHVAGTIGASGDSGGHIAGVSWHVSILPIKFLDANGAGSLADAVKAIQYATLMKARIISNSWDGGPFSQAMLDAITDAQKNGILFVAAAGNDGDDNDSDVHPHYPASYQVDNVIAVAATTNRDTLADFSTYGKRTVHIAAPGDGIYSSVPNGKYATLSGTSMATPHVSGAAALVWGANMNMTYAEIKERLLRSRDFVPALSKKISTSGRLNIYNALAGIYPPSPEPPDADWKDFDIVPTIESQHPYENYTKQDFVIEGPENSKLVRVVFSKVDLENGMDFVHVLDENGKEVDTITGRSQNFVSYFATGRKMTLRFTSDSSIVGWGFAVAKGQFVAK